jgi:cell filamentation protein, protein adenylyltransferase
MALIERVLKRRIQAKLEQLAAYKPFPVETISNLNELVTVSMTYHSNAIEGSTMRLMDVDLALGGYKIPGEHTAEEIAETVGHAQAWHHVEQDATSGAPMRADLIIELHDMVKPYHPQRGEWRKQQVYIRGAQHVPPPASEVPRYMDEWTRYVNRSEADPIEHAARAHTGFEAVHPFLDGNGRTGRLLINWMLLRAGYPPAIIQVEERARYIQALAAATLPPPLDYKLIAQLLAERVDASLTLYLSSLVPDDTHHEISLEEAAERVGLSARRLRGLATEGKLEARRYGKRWVTWPAALDTYLQTRNPVGKPKSDDRP